MRCLLTEHFLLRESNEGSCFVLRRCKNARCTTSRAHERSHIDRGTDIHGVVVAAQRRNTAAAANAASTTSNLETIVSRSQGMLRFVRTTCPASVSLRSIRNLFQSTNSTITRDGVFVCVCVFVRDNVCACSITRDASMTLHARSPRYKPVYS